ncbi:hypothetical protein EMG21_28125 [Klebsiella pneumoniae]|nr:hypothetical protein EMG21_28125 [Klebsiella pneumoniae]
MDKDKEISALDYARMKGKSRAWASRLANSAKEAGFEYPRRVGNYWLATPAEWEKILAKLGIKLRNRTSYRKEDTEEN